MALQPDVVARGLSGRRVMNLRDNVSEHYGRAEQTPTIPRIKPTNGTRGNINRLGTRPSATPAFQSAGFQPITNNLGLTGLRLPQIAVGSPLAGGQSRFTTGPSNSSATPNIAVSPNPQQLAFSSPSSLHSGTEQFHHLTVGNLSHYGPRMPNRNRGIGAMLIVECDLAVRVVINTAFTHSSICRDVFQTAASRSNAIRSYPNPPPGHYTTLIVGYNSYGGEFTQLTLRSGMGTGDDEGRDITLPLTIIDRGFLGHGNGGIEVDIVLGQDYLRLISSQNMTIVPQGQFEGTQYPNQNYPGWQVTGRSQDVTIPAENAVFPGYQNAMNFAPLEWGSGNNHLHPQSQGVNPSPSWTMVSSQGGGSHPVSAPSTTGPDMSFGPAPLN